MTPVNTQPIPVCQWRLEQHKDIEIRVNRTATATIFSLFDTALREQLALSQIHRTDFNFSECYSKTCSENEENLTIETRLFRNGPRSTRCIGVQVNLQDRSIETFIRNSFPDNPQGDIRLNNYYWDIPTDPHAEEGMIRKNEEIVKIWTKEEPNQLRLIQRTENEQVQLICMLYNKNLKSGSPLEIFNQDLPTNNIEDQKAYLIQSDDLKIINRESDYKRGVVFEYFNDATRALRINDPLHPSTGTCMTWRISNTTLEMRIERIEVGYLFKIYNLSSTRQWPNSQQYSNEIEKCIWKSNLKEPSQEELNTPGYQNHQPFDIRVFRHKNDLARNTSAVCIGVKPSTQEINIVKINNLEMTDQTDLIFVWPEGKELSFIRSIEISEKSSNAEIGITKNNESIIKVWENVMFDNSKDLQWFLRSSDDKKQHRFKLIDKNDPNFKNELNTFSILSTDIKSKSFDALFMDLTLCNRAEIKCNAAGIPESVLFSRSANIAPFGYFFRNRENLSTLSCEEITQKVKENLRINVDGNEVKVDESYLQRASTTQIMGYNFGDDYGGKKDCFHTVIERRYAAILKFPKGVWGFIKALISKNSEEVQITNVPNNEHNEGLARLVLGDPSQSQQEKVQLIEKMNICLASCSKFELYISYDQACAIVRFDHKQFVISAINAGRSVRGFAIDAPTQMAIRGLSSTLSLASANMPRWLGNSYMAHAAEYLNALHNDTVTPERKEKILAVTNTFQADLETKFNTR